MKNETVLEKQKHFQIGFAVSKMPWQRMETTSHFQGKTFFKEKN